MMLSDNPFLVKMNGTAQDDTNLYMMMEAVMGGELFGYLQVREEEAEAAEPPRVGSMDEQGFNIKG
jgi:hypothetical protein